MTSEMRVPMAGWVQPRPRFRGRWVGATRPCEAGSISGRCALEAGGQLTETSRRLPDFRNISKGTTLMNEDKVNLFL